MTRPNNPAVGLVTSKGWTLERVVASGPRFRTVDKISANSRTPEQIASSIKDYEQRNTPLVVQDLHGHPDWPEFFTPQWLESHYGSQMVEVCNVHGERLAKQLSVAEFIDNMRNAPQFAHQEEYERLYGKDMNCPAEWRNWIKTSGVLPDLVIPGAVGDILPETVETLMTYLGVSDTFTPWHKDPCASYGQNVMCYTVDGGSSYWFMTNPSDCGAVTDYFRGLGHELDWEDHVASIEELAKAPFDVYIWEQNLGDLVLVPPRSFHQVINAGGITIKTSWSRMSIRSLEIALYHELPRYQRVCRSEIYRVKRTIYDTLVQRTDALNALVHDNPEPTFDAVNPLCKEVDRLIPLLDDVLEQEYSARHPRVRQVTNGFTPGGQGHTCDFCGADIFLSSFQCTSCSLGGGSGDPICLCPTCVVEGRSCKCGSMEPVQSGDFRELLRSRNNAMVKLRDARTAGFYGGEPEELSDQHLVESVATTFQAARLLLDKRREILNSPKTTRTCTLRKNTKSHVVDGWGLIICKDCHSGKCFAHILEAGIHSSEALRTVNLDQTYGKWHSIHTGRLKRYEKAVPSLLQAMALGTPTPISDRLVYFARTFQTPRPMSEQVSLGFYDKKLPDPDEVDQLDPPSVADFEPANSQTRGTPVKPFPPPLDLGSSAAPAVAEDLSRKRKRSSKTPNPKAEPDLPSRLSTENRASERSSVTSQSSKRLKMDCVLITTLPPVLHGEATPLETSQDEGRIIQATTSARGREKQRGKRRETVLTSGASVRSDSQSLAARSTRSQSHSVSSLRRPLFDPETSPPPIPADSDEEYSVKLEPDVVDDSEDEVSLPSVSRYRKRIESTSPTSPVDTQPSPHLENLPYYAVVNTVHRPPGSGVRFAPNQRQIAKTQSSIYRRSQVHQPVAGPSRITQRVGPPKRMLLNRPEPRRRPVTEPHPPRPPPPHPESTSLEARMNTYEAKMSAFVDENQKLRDELATVTNELVATRDELAGALTRIGVMEHGLQGLEALEPRLDGMRDEYERLSNLLRGEHLFDSEKFHTAIQSEVKVGIGYYWPSLKTDMKNQLWKDLPPPVKEYLEKEIGNLVEEVALIRSELVVLQQNPPTRGNFQDGDPAIIELRRTIERVEKKQEEFERVLRSPTSSVPKLSPNMPPPNLPPKPPSPWVSDPRQGPQQRRGAETSPAVSSQNSHPIHQGPDDKMNSSLQAGPTQDPRRGTTPLRPPPPLPPIPAHSPPPEPISPRSTTHLAYSHIPPSTSGPPTPTLPQLFNGMHPSRAAQFETNAFGPATATATDSEPVIITDSPNLQPSPPVWSVPMSRTRSAPSIQTQPPAGMHPDRIAFLSARDRPSSAATPTQLPPRPTPDVWVQDLPKGELLGDRRQSLLTFPTGMGVTTPGPTPSSSCITVDDIIPSGFPPLTSSAISRGSGRDPNQSPVRGKGGKGAQKRRASDAFPSPQAPKPPKMQKVGKGKAGKGTPRNGNNVDGPGAAKTQGKGKKRRGKKKKGQTNLNDLPGLSNSPPEDGEVGEEGEWNDNYGGW